MLTQAKKPLSAAVDKPRDSPYTRLIPARGSPRCRYQNWSGQDPGAFTCLDPLGTNRVVHLGMGTNAAFAFCGRTRRWKI